MSSSSVSKVYLRRIQAQQCLLVCEHVQMCLQYVHIKLKCWLLKHLCTKSLDCALCCASFQRNSVKWTLFIRLSGATTMNSLKLELMKVRLVTFMCQYNWQTKRRTLHFIFYHVHMHTRPRELAHPQHHKQNLNLVLSTWEHFDSFITIWKRSQTVILSKEVLSVSNCAWTEDFQSCKTWLWNTLWDLDSHTDTIRINTTSFVTEQI